MWTGQKISDLRWTTVIYYVEVKLNYDTNIHDISRKLNERRVKNVTFSVTPFFTTVIITVVKNGLGFEGVKASKT